MRSSACLCWPWLCLLHSLGARCWEVGWNSRVRPNEVSGPWRAGFKERDPWAEGWVRSRDDAGVVELQQRLEKHNCMPQLKVFSPRSPSYNMSQVVRTFRHDGFVVLEDVLTESELSALVNATEHIMTKIFEVDPEGSFGGGAGKLPHRYSLGDASATKSNFHLPAYSDLIDLQTASPLLREIFGSADYLAAGSGGDVALAGAVEYQVLHPDAIWGVQEGRVADLKIPPAVTINFVLEDGLTPLNGAMRVVPGSHRWHQRPPRLLEEPDWMMFNTLCPVQSRSAIVRDINGMLWLGRVLAKRCSACSAD
eukprot:TRINITY_DN81835_c0_g1_i1.p1 TRINITY_DN81835_c0_g1~~TRINITY_DN81835_c0_g1_i1.p1  ORF type:complete len:309 (+),score=54.02 TRINITY_DN81835_c0_g1_i1:29-955(+)